MVSDATAILAFDTSAAHCAAALLCGDRIVAERLEPMSRGQAERLMPLVEEVLAKAGLHWPDLSALGVGTGPGNFTGTRISVAAARGLALSLGIPAVGVTGFDALAFGNAGALLTALPAPRGEVYVHDMGADAPWRGLPEDLPDRWRGSGLAVRGASAAALAALTGGDVLPTPDNPAPAIARVAATRMHGPVSRPAPFYLRAADAAPPADPPPAILP